MSPEQIQGLLFSLIVHRSGDVKPPSCLDSVFSPPRLLLFPLLFSFLGDTTHEYKFRDVIRDRLKTLSVSDRHTAHLRQGSYADEERWGGIHIRRGEELCTQWLGRPRHWVLQY